MQSATAARLLIALLALVLVGWGLGVLSRFALTRADLRVMHDVAFDPTPAQITIAHVFSWMGSGYVVFPLTLVCCGILVLRGRRSWALAVGLSTLGAVVIADLDKRLVGRPRPPVHHLDTVTSPSFPSGHAAQSTALVLALVIAVGATHRPRWLKIAAATAGWLLVMSIAASRVYLGVHYPSDVTFGVLLGAAWSVVVNGNVAAPTAREVQRGRLGGVAKPD